MCWNILEERSYIITNVKWNKISYHTYIHHAIKYIQNYSKSNKVENKKFLQTNKYLFSDKTYFWVLSFKIIYNEILVFN